jgi:RHS repeat-associated protein
MVTRYGYDAWSHNTTITYPSGIVVTNVYDTKGYVNQINNGSSILWKMNSSDSRGRPVSYNLGDPNLGLNVQFTYDTQGRLATKTTVQMKQTYVFDPNSGNLSSRDYRTAGSQTGLYETFGYDPQNRLTSSTAGATTTSVIYSPNGNINNKSDAGGYGYDPTKVNAVSNISVSGGTIDPTQQTITYNASNLTTQIKLGATEYNIKYNPFNERIKTVNNIDAVTKYYSGNYEMKIKGGVSKEYHYINSPYGLVAIIESIGTAIQNTWYAETDHLGSIIGLLRSDKSYAEKLSFDAWGKRRNPLTWTYQGFIPPTLIDRGFTGHEHLDSLGLINANGRMYDPVIGRFLGVDPFVQDAGFSQSYNGYSYCLNNPLKFTDPSGYTASVTGDGDPNPWAAYIRFCMRGYNEGYDNFLAIYDDYLFNGNRGFSGSGGPSSMTLSYYSKSISYGGFISIPGYQSIREVIVGNEKHTITVDFPQGQGGPGEMSFNDKALFVVPTSINDLTNVASGQAWEKSVNYVKIGSAEAQAQKLLSGVVRTTKYIGWAGNVVDVSVNGINAYNHWNSPDVGFYQAKAIGSGVIVGLNLVNIAVPGLGTVLSITAGAIDAAGGFDFIYNEFR